MNFVFFSLGWKTCTVSWLLIKLNPSPSWMWDFHHVYKEHIAKCFFLSRAVFSDRNIGIYLWINNYGRNTLSDLCHISVNRHFIPQTIYFMLQKNNFIIYTSYNYYLPEYLFHQTWFWCITKFLCYLIVFFNVSWINQILTFQLNSFYYIRWMWRQERLNSMINFITSSTINYSLL